jgi:hypothetical protein
MHCVAHQRIAPGLESRQIHNTAICTKTVFPCMCYHENEKSYRYVRTIRSCVCISGLTSVPGFAISRLETEEAS